MAPHPCLTISTPLILEHIDEARSLISKELENGFDLRLNLSTITQCDTCGVQFLFALNQTILQHSGALILQDPTPCITSALKLFGIKSDFTISKSDDR